MKRKNIEFHQVNPFDVKVSYVEIDSLSELNVHQAHIHEECEIYINISGNVSFAVEDSIYPLVPGSVIITKPYECHHCVYHSNDLHKHFWILFSSQCNEYLFDLFFKRNSGKENLLILSPDKAKMVSDICFRLMEDNSEAKKYYLFFCLMDLLSESKGSEDEVHIKNDCLSKALRYINCDISQNMSVNELAQRCYTSVNTLERIFKQNLNISPYEYIKKKRLVNAAKLLKEGFSVTESAEKSGFSDCSNFISVFKKYYGVTPLKYKKQKLNM